MNGQIVQSGKGTNLQLNTYLYRRDKRFATKQHWRCTVRGCWARVHADPPVILKESAHSHPPDDELARSKRLKTEMCKTARDTPLVPLTQVNFYTFITFVIDYRSVCNAVHWRPKIHYS